jgi:hypothetical protein
VGQNLRLKILLGSEFGATQVFQSTVWIERDPIGFHNLMGSSEQWTSGFAVARGVALCPDVIQSGGGVQSDRPIRTLILRGYLIQGRRRASRG